MPNHVTNRLIIKGTEQQIKEVFEKYNTINDETNQFPDFDKIIQYPRCDEYNDIPSQEQVKDSPNWWYTWNLKNWGTKWNSYSNEEFDFGTYLFETAWSGVLNLMIELSKQNPEIEFNYTYADEDSGYNVGNFIIKNGTLLKSETPDGGTKEAYEIYFELNPDSKEYYTFNGNSYEYINEED